MTPSPTNPAVSKDTVLETAYLFTTGDGPTYEFSEKNLLNFVQIILCSKTESSQAMTTEEKLSLDPDRIWNAMPASLCNDPYVKNLYRISKSAQPESAPLQAEDAKRLRHVYDTLMKAFPLLNNLDMSFEKWLHAIDDERNAAIAAQGGEQI